ncbi:hypothetical protein CDL15_Pgr027125 [Punica granatum]|nr:hypothetical protein CDL15_Pgr027125 [Punica granatum]
MPVCAFAPARSSPHVLLRLCASDVPCMHAHPHVPDIQLARSRLPACPRLPHALACTSSCAPDAFQHPGCLLQLPDHPIKCT